MADIWDALGPSALILGGAAISGSANSRAAQQAGQAAIQGAQIQADAIREGNARAQATLDQIRKESAPATGYLRSVMAEPGELTPLQQTQLEQSRRDINNTIHNSSFAGAGRTAAALFKKNDTDFRNEAINTNVGRADQAAHSLYGAGTGATTGIASLESNTGSTTGKALGDAYSKAGLYDAQAGLATGNATGKAIGDIGSLIANEGRQSRYADTLSNINTRLKNIGA